MSDERSSKINKTRHCEVERIALSSNPEKLRIHLLGRTEPAVFDGAASQWACSEWTPGFLALELGDLRTRFRFCARQNSSVDGNPCKKTIMETDCEFEKASFEEFIEWLNGCTERSGCLSRFQRHDYWCYADYKYMAELFKDFPHLRQSVNWGCFGFPKRSGDESTIWIGSAEASTPCHFDTYGCNLVAQIYGKKKWTLFPPSETFNLYPTRIPYEESSVFSQVNITNPDLTKFPAFGNTLRYEVILKPGDVLFVPKKWWHYVESLETSISINTWIELESDHIERVKEAMIRTLVCALKKEEGAAEVTWLNPSQEIGTHTQNMGYLYQALCAVKQKTTSDVDPGDLAVRRPRHEDKYTNNVLSTDDLINCITSPDVINAVTVQVLKKFGISQTSNLPLESSGLERWESEATWTVTSRGSYSDNPCYGSYQLDESVKSEHVSEILSQSSNEQEINEHPALKRMCTDKERNWGYWK